MMWGRFHIPVLALFYIASQVPIEQFAIIMAVFSFTTLFLEIPSGVIADLIGKKKTLLLSRFLYVVEIFMLAFYDGFWVFLIAKIISGIGVSLTSGTDSALMFETLKKLGREKDHKKISGTRSMITNISMAVVMITGSYLFSINYKLPAIVSLPILTLGFILTFFIFDPSEKLKGFSFKNFISHFKESVRMFWHNPYLKFLAFFTLIIGALISIILSMSSAYYELIIPVTLIGSIAFISSMLTAFASKKAHALEEIIGERKSIFLIQSVILISLLLASIYVNYLGIMFMLIISLVVGFYGIVINDYVNRHVVDSHRVAMLSVNNMFDNIGVTILFPIVGFITLHYQVKYSLLFLVLISGIYLFIVGIFFRALFKKNNKIQQ
jgi:MFS family permease